MTKKVSVDELEGTVEGADAALAEMQSRMEHAFNEDCMKLPAVWVNNFRLSYTDGAVIMVLSDAQDPTGRHLPRARGSFVMPVLMLEQLVEGIGPQYLERIREAKKNHPEDLGTKQ
jgi:hypothetical protein